MGWAPAQVGQCSIWQFMAALEGYGRSQGWKEQGAGGDLTEDQLRDMGIEGF